MKSRIAMLLVVVAAIGSPARAKPMAPALSAYSAKLSCVDKSGLHWRADGPWRIPAGRPALGWSIGFPHVFHVHAGGETCTLLTGPSRTLGRASADSPGAYSGRAPYLIYLECFSPTFVRWVAVPNRGVIASHFSVDQSSLCRIYAGGAGLKPLYQYPVPLSLDGVWNGDVPRTRAVPTYQACTAPVICTFRVRATPDMRWRFEYATDYTGYLSLTMDAAGWSSIYHCAIANGMETYCYSEGSPGIPSPGSIVDVYAESISSRTLRWAAGIDSRPRWPA